MPAPPAITIDLGTKPARRLAPLADYAEAARAVAAPYLGEIGEIAKYSKQLRAFRTAYIRRQYVAELAAMSEITGLSLDQTTALNCYYDGLKFVFHGMPSMGCTAFVVDTPDGPLHARNLDWWSDNQGLSEHTLVYDFQRDRRSHYRNIAWPGFNGVLSGIAPGRFAITLNAVLSEDPSALGRPIVYTIRDVLDTAKDFAAAVDTLATAKIPCDCLLMVSGTQPGEMCVIERTPRRHAIRRPVDGFVAVTNDYRAISGQPPGMQGQIGASTCQRFDTACAHLRDRLPQTPEGCLAILDAVRMDITVQQMTFHPRSGQQTIR